MCLCEPSRVCSAALPWCAAPHAAASHSLAAGAAGRAPADASVPRSAAAAGGLENHSPAGSPPTAAPGGKDPKSVLHYTGHRKNKHANNCNRFTSARFLASQSKAGIE